MCITHMNELLKQKSMVVSCHPFKKVLCFGASCKGICSKGHPKKATKSSKCFCTSCSHVHVLFFLIMIPNEIKQSYVGVFQNWGPSKLPGYCFSRTSWLWSLNLEPNHDKLMSFPSISCHKKDQQTTLPLRVPSCFGALRPAGHVMRTCSNAGHGGSNEWKMYSP